MKKLYKEAYKHRFDVYLIIQLLVLFGILIFPDELYENIITPILLSLFILAGTVIISKKRKLLWFCLVLFAGSLFFFGAEEFFKNNGKIIFRYFA